MRPSDAVSASFVAQEEAPLCELSGEEVHLFVSLTSEERQVVLRRCRKVTFAAGTTIVKADEISAAMYILVSGRLQSDRESLCRVGCVVGEKALLQMRCKETAVVASETAVMLELRYDDIYPDLSQLLRKIFSRRKSSAEKPIRKRSRLAALAKAMTRSRRHTLYLDIHPDVIANVSSKPPFYRSPEDIEILRKLLAQSACFEAKYKSLSADAKETLYRSLTFERIEPLATIDNAENKVILSGLVRSDDFSLGPGDVIDKRHSRYVAATTVHLIVIKEPVLKQLTLDQKVAALSANPLFRSWEKSRLERVAHLLREKHYPRGKVLFREDQTSTRMIFIVDGAVALSKNLIVRRSEASSEMRVQKDPLGIPRIFEAEPPQSHSQKKIVHLLTVQGHYLGESAAFQRRELCTATVSSSKLVTLELPATDFHSSFDSNDLEALDTASHLRSRWRQKRIDAITGDTTTRIASNRSVTEDASSLRLRSSPLSKQHTKNRHHSKTSLTVDSTTTRRRFRL